MTLGLAGCSEDPRDLGFGTTGNTAGSGADGGMQEGGADGSPGPTTSGPNTPGEAGALDADTLGDGECAAIRRDSPEGKGGVDVIFLLDTSGSMLHATTQVQANLASFIQEFEGTDADTRVVMITGADPAAGSPVASDAERYRFIQAEVDSSALFTVALAQRPQYQDFLRPNAATQFVMITDDDDAIPPATFRTEMEAALGKPFTQHAIASEEFMGGPCISEINAGNPLCIPGLVIPAVCGAAAIGTTYYQLADMTGGVQASVCKADWTEVFAQLKNAVIDAVPLPCDYPLTEAIGESFFDKDQVKIVYSSSVVSETEFGKVSAGASGCPADQPAWYYDDPDDPQVIQLCPKACETVSEGGAIDVVFGCPPSVLY